MIILGCSEKIRQSLVLALIFGCGMPLGLHCAFGSETTATDKVLQDQLAKQRAEAERRNLDTSKMSTNALERQKKIDQAQKDKAGKAANLAEYKESTMTNLASIKELFMKAEGEWKAKNYATACPIYSSVALATVPGSEQMTETARGRLIEVEKLAQDALKDADDADIQQDFVKEVELLSGIVKAFESTKMREAAQRHLIALKSRPEVAGYVEISLAEALEADNKLTEAVALYNTIANNPRYENTVPALKANRRAAELMKNSEISDKMKAEQKTKSDKEAPQLMASAKNYLVNKLPKQAIEKLQTLVDKYPDSPLAEQARKQIEEIKGMD